MMKRLGIGLLIGSALVLPLQSHASASAAPPVITSSSANPSPVTAGSQVTFEWSFTSDAGSQSTNIFVNGPNSSFLSNCGANPSLISGTIFAGTYQSICTVPASAQNGGWSTSIQLVDNAGQTIDPAGPSFPVTGGSDAAPPVITSSSANPSPVTAGSQVTFEWSFTSDAGSQSTNIFVNAPNSSFLSNCGANPSLISGTIFAGTYQSICTVPASAQNGG